MSIAQRGTRQRGSVHRWALVLAAAALAAFLGSTGLLSSNGMQDPALGSIGFVLGAVAGPLAFAVAAVLLMYSAEQLSGRAVVWTAVSALPAVGLTALAQASWAVGFDEADAGGGLSWFGSATLYFVALAWLFGTLTLLAPLGSALNQGTPFLLRPLRTVVLAAISAAVLGPVMALAYLVGPLAGGLLLVLALRLGGHGPGTVAWMPGPLLVSVDDPAAAPTSQSPSPLPSLARPVPATRRRDAAVGVAALTTVGAGAACAVFALTGSSWTSAAADATHAMNLGLGAGALAALPAAAAAGGVLAARYGAVILWSTLALCAGLVLEATAQFLGAGHPGQWPFTVAAAAATGFALVLPYGRLIRGGLFLRLGMTILLGLAAALVGVFLVTAAGFIAPPAAVVLLVWSVRRLAGRGGQVRPQPA